MDTRAACMTHLLPSFCIIPTGLETSTHAAACTHHEGSVGRKKCQHACQIRTVSAPRDTHMHAHAGSSAVSKRRQRRARDQRKRQPPCRLHCSILCARKWNAICATRAIARNARKRGAARCRRSRASSSAALYQREGVVAAGVTAALQRQLLGRRRQQRHARRLLVCVRHLPVDLAAAAGGNAAGAGRARELNTVVMPLLPTLPRRSGKRAGCGKSSPSSRAAKAVRQASPRRFK